MILSGLANGGLALALAPYARPEQLDVPPFESGSYQFTLLQPRRDVPAVRPFRLDGATVERSALKGRPILLPPDLLATSRSGLYGSEPSILVSGEQSHDFEIPIDLARRRGVRLVGLHRCIPRGRGVG
jgi:hypothetical protein